jgi:DNA polymerase III alpha subunit
MSDGEDLDRVQVTLSDALELNIKINPLSINKSNYHYEYVNDNEIDMGLITIK